MGNSLSFKPHKAFEYQLHRGARVLREEQVAEDLRDEEKDEKMAKQQPPPKWWNAPMP